MLRLIVESCLLAKGIVAVTQLHEWLSCNWLFSILSQRNLTRMMSEMQMLLACCDTDFHQMKPINYPTACWTSAIVSSEFLSIEGFGSVGGGRSHDSRFIDRIKRRNTTMLLIISMLSFFYTKLQLV